MYEIRAFVGERPVLEKCFPEWAQTIVDLGEGAFALIPIAGTVEADFVRLTGVEFDDLEFSEKACAPVLHAVAARSGVWDSQCFAFVAAESFGGAGASLGVAYVTGDLRIFNDPENKWPDTNISLALKAVGVPERLDERLDAFDVLGLGRNRLTQEWLEMAGL